MSSSPLSRLGVLLALAAVCAVVHYSPAWADAANPSEPLPGARLPAGEVALKLAWLNASTVTVLVRTTQGYAVRDLDIASGEFSVVGVPPGFKRYRPADNSGLQLSLAPDGKGLAVLEPAPGPLKPRPFAVFKRIGNVFSDVELHQVPGKFWPSALAWGQNGTLFVAAQPYLFPDQPYSIGKLELASGNFTSLVLKSNLDLVSELTVLPGRSLLVARCGGYRGEYPAEPVVAAWDLDANQTSLLDARAQGLTLSSLDDSEALLLASGDRAEGWVLGTRDAKLRRLDKGLVVRSRARAISPDGKWLGLVVAGHELSGELEPQELYVAMQETGSGRTIATAVPCSQFAFAPDSAHFASLAKDGGKIYYYALPHVAPTAASPASTPAPNDSPPQRDGDKSRGAGNSF